MRFSREPFLNFSSRVESCLCLVPGLNFSLEIQKFFPGRVLTVTKAEHKLEKNNDVCYPHACAQGRSQDFSKRSGGGVKPGCHVVFFTCCRLFAKKGLQKGGSWAALDIPSCPPGAFVLLCSLAAYS